MAPKIIDLDESRLDLYCHCLEDWSDEMAESGPHKRRWYDAAHEQGLRVKLALDEHGEAGGMIQYLPIEASHVEGEGLYFVLCVWVHGHRKGRGNFQRRGMGRALLQAAEDDARARGAKGMAAWGLWIPAWMKASWFRKRGYCKVDRDGLALLVWKPFVDDAQPPRWIRQKKRPQAAPGVVRVAAFKRGWCPGQNIAFERTRRACEDIGDPRVRLEVYDTNDPAVFDAWGITDAIYVDRRAIGRGPPPRYERIRKVIEKRLRRL